jgi:hypothetical protein
MLGLSEEKPKPKPDQKKATTKPAAQSDEAKAMLAKMKAKNDAGDCAFC